jgi:signal peptidase I
MVRSSRSAAKLLLLLALVAFVAGWFLLFRPSFLGGGATYIMVEGISMEPTLTSGDLAIVHKQGSYSPGDIVAFRAEGAIVIHRIIRGSAEEGYVVQGDNKEVPDLWRPTGEDILGRMWLRIPAGGHVLMFLRQPLVLGSLAGGLGMLTVLGGGQGQPAPSTSMSPSRPRAASAPVSPGTRLALGQMLTAALNRVIGLLRKKDRRTPG